MILINIFFIYFLSIVNHIKLEKAELLILTKRLTEKQKEEIVECFKFGANVHTLAQKNSCTNSTIIRTLKKNLGELKYKELTNKSKSLKEKLFDISNVNSTYGFVALQKGSVITNGGGKTVIISKCHYNQMVVNNIFVIIAIVIVTDRIWAVSFAGHTVA